MNNDTKVINHAAQQIAEMFKKAVMSQQQNGNDVPTIAAIETSLREALRQIGLQALGLFLSSMQTTPVAEIPCACGGHWRINGCEMRR